jgi:DNA-binding transcriptional ArsR family regulator
MSDARETPDPLVLVQAAAVEALLASGRTTFTEIDLEQTLAWLAEPARSETLRALRRHGWLEADPHGFHRLTEAGRRIHDALRAVLAHGAQNPPIPDGLTLEEIVQALLSRSLEELATAGREALVPILSSPPLLTTKTVVQVAETHALQGGHPAPRRRLNG